MLILSIITRGEKKPDDSLWIGQTKANFQMLNLLNTFRILIILLIIINPLVTFSLSSHFLAFSSPARPLTPAQVLGHTDFDLFYLIYFMFF